MDGKPTCREIHALLSAGLDRPLTLMEQVRMRGHLLHCRACLRFQRQLAFLRRTVRVMSRRRADDPPFDDG